MKPSGDEKSGKTRGIRVREFSEKAGENSESGEEEQSN